MAVQQIANAMLAQNGAPTPAPFVWGANGEMLTPQQVAQQRQIAQSMMAQAPAPRTLGEGLSAVGRALIAKSMLDQATQQQTEGLAQAGKDFAAVQGDPTQAAKFIANDPYATPGQLAVAQAMMQQQFQLTSPDAIAQRANLASETARNNAEAAMYGTGGAAVGAPIFDAAGNPYIATQYGTNLRPLAAAGGAPSLGGSPDAGASGYVTPPAADGTPVPLAPLPSPAQGAGPVPAPMGNQATPSPAGAGRFLTPAQQKQAEAAGTVEGTYQGGLIQNQQRAAQALEEQNIVNKSLLGGTDAQGNVTPGLIDQAIALAKNPIATGIPGQVSEGISGTPAANLDEILKQIDSNAATKAIQDFRDSAPAGATGMRITQAEALMFGKTLSNISAHQSSAQLVQQLTTLKSQLQQISGGMKDSYSRLYGGLPPVKSSQLDAFPDGYALPMDGAAPAAAPSAPTPVTKTIGGVTYSQGADGKWYSP
jgi:hypothetical protein